MRYRKILPVLFSVILLFCFSRVASAQTTWSLFFGGELEDQFASAQQTADGGYIAVGSAASYGEGDHDLWLVRIDSSGNVIWNFTFGDRDEDFGNSVQQTADGGFIVLGTTRSYAVNDVDFWLIKTDANGEIQWQKTYDAQSVENASEVRQTTDGGYILVGRVEVGSNDQNVLLVRTDANGNSQWMKSYGGSGIDVGVSVCESPDGGFFVAGRTTSYGSGPQDGWLLKTNGSGTKLWGKPFGSIGYDTFTSVRATTDGNLIIAGSGTPSGTSMDKAWLVKTDLNGTELWSNMYGGHSRDNAFSVDQTADGGYVLTGRTRSYSGPWEIWLIKTDASGNESWIRTFNNPGSAGWSVSQTADGGYFIAGSTGPPPDGWLIKTDAEGRLIKPTARSQLASVESAAEAVASDAELIYVSGDIEDTTGTADAWKYIYKSTSKDQVFEFLLSGSSVIQQPGISVNDPTIHAGIRAFPTAWIDSDSAVAVAERNGGKDFRATRPWVAMGARLFYVEGMCIDGTDIKYPYPVWEISYYGSDVDRMEVHVDGVMGRLVNDFPVTTARDGLTQADAAAQNVDPDAELVFVWTSQVDAEGQAPMWLYVYEASGTQTMVEFAFIGAELLYQMESQMLPWVSPGRTPVPQEWLDSDEAMATAEADGGAGFRAAYPEAIIDMNLYAYSGGLARSLPGGIKLVWDIYYIAQDTTFRSVVDAGIYGFCDYFTRTFGGSEDDVGYGVVQLEDESIVIAGMTESYGAGKKDTWLIGIEKDGEEAWNRTHGGSEDECAQNIVLAEDDGFLIVDNTSSFGNGQYDFDLLKTDGRGEERLGRCFGGGMEDYAYAVHRASDGGYVMAGKTESYGAGESDVWLIKIDTQGDMVWDQTFGGDSADIGYDMQTTSDGGFIIVGSTRSSGGGSRDVYLVKADSLGAEEWSMTFGGSKDDIGYGVQQTSDEGYILAGYTESYGAGKKDLWLIKTDSLGAQEWERSFGGSEDDIGKSLVISEDGGYAIAGRTESAGAGMQDLWLIKTNPEGGEEWSRVLGGSEDDFGESVAITSDGGYLITGGTCSYGAGGCDVWLIKTDASGYSPVQEDRSARAPEQITLLQNYPNPFNGTTTIHFILPRPGRIVLKIYDTLGRCAATLIDGFRQAGEYDVQWDAADLASGIYLCRLSAGDLIETRKMLLVE